MDRFDKVFCWTITVIVGVSGVYFLATTHSMLEGIFVGAMCTVCVYVTWAHVATQSRKVVEQQILDSARIRFDLAASRFMRALDDGVAGSPSRWTAEGRELLAAWNEYRGLLERNGRR